NKGCFTRRLCTMKLHRPAPARFLKVHKAPITMDKRRMCPHCRAFITTDDKVCPYCNTRVGARAVDQRAPQDALGGLIPQAQFVTVLLLLVNTGFYVATLLYTQHKSGKDFDLNPSFLALVAFGGKYPDYIRLGQWWRLITAGLLHGNILHI